MGSEKVALGQDGTVTNPDFVKSNRTNDHSNPQQGTGAAKKSITQDKKSHSRQNTSDRNLAASKFNSLPPSSYGEDKRKLFVGGLPTDITDPEFRYFFSQFGELHESVVMFDRETRRSRGFGFVTYVNPDVSQSLLQMGNSGDGIGRLVMRGKTCEIKAAAPRGQAPTRGVKSNRMHRGPRSQHQVQARQVPSFGYNEQFPVMYQNASFNMSYSQDAHSVAPGVPSYAPQLYHDLPAQNYAQTHSQPHGIISLSTDSDVSGSGIVGPPYSFASHLTSPTPDRFSLPNAFPPIPSYYPQQGYAFIPYIPEHHTQLPLPAMEVPSMIQPIQQSIRASEEGSYNDERIKVKKE